MEQRFADRAQAGRLLAQAVARLGLVDAVVLALPRGGVPVAAEVARELKAPLDLLLVRKIGAPGQPELAVAAVAEGEEPAVVIDQALCDATGADAGYVQRQAREQWREIDRRRALYLAGRERVPLAGRPVLVVDDGIATGTTVRAALAAVRRQKPARLVLAVPVAPPDTVERLRADVDQLVCLSTPAYFRAVGLHYDDFHQVEDDEVIAILRAAAADATRVS